MSGFQSQPERLFKYLTSFTSKKDCRYPIFHDDAPVADPTIKANLFNRYFNSVFTRSKFVLPPLNSLPTPSEQLSSIEITSSDVFSVLNRLDVHKAQGPDGLHPAVLKGCAVALCDPLAHLFNVSVASGELPQEWKVHKIVPVPKSANRSSVSNFRPISLLCTVSKVLEHIVYSHIIEFVRPKISRCQFGFLKQRSCLKGLLSSLSVVVDAIDQGSYCDAIFLDFRKAFDSIPHSELLFKVWRLGITGDFWFWLRSYLSYRTHYVDVEGHSSGSLPVISGVPQGSVLGPLLFLIYVNDLPQSILTSYPFLFADDTKLLSAIKGHSDSLALQEDLAFVEDWCSKWSLSLNPTKCVAMRFSLSTTNGVCQYQYHLNGVSVPNALAHRDLGVCITSQLSWSDHISNVCCKAYASLFLLRLVLPANVSPALFLKLYKVLVRSQLSYCSQIWRPVLIKDIVSLERIQRKATKSIL